MSPPGATEQAFLDDIVAQPEDVSLWHILADWLEDQDDPRGELVRLTWKLQYEADNPEFAARQKRVQALLADGVMPVRPRVTLEGIEFAWVPAGTFLMGAPKGEHPRSGHVEDRHRVRLTRPFWIGVTPVTQGQWQTLVGNNPASFSRVGAMAEKVEKLDYDELDRLPVEMVSWHGARDFCAKLGRRLRRTARLPTEAEWEYACRAGTTTPFSFGKILDGRQANCRESFGTKKKCRQQDRPTVVGSYRPNPWGLWDVHGNVWEWCADGYDENSYVELDEVDPFRDEAEPEYCVQRGGAWNYAGFCSRSAHRANDRPTETRYDTGFRVCLPVE
jgi:uncharacterized protein (TIGR02996 family)